MFWLYGWSGKDDFLKSNFESRFDWAGFSKKTSQLNLDPKD